MSADPLTLEEALDALAQAERDARELANVSFHELIDGGMDPGSAGATVIDRVRQSLRRTSNDLASAMIDATMMRVTIEEIDELLRREAGD